MVPASWRSLCSTLFAFMGLTASCSGPAPQSDAPTHARVQTIVAASPLIGASYAGRARGVRDVEVRARVSGILEKRHYQEGSFVRQGDLLFRIDPAPYAAAVRSASGSLKVEQARLTLARQRHDRIEALHKRGFASGSNRDEAAGELASARAAVDAARAELDRARLDLSFTYVRAPISGMTGMETVSEGSLVDAGSQTASLLTTITQTGDLYVDFSVPEAEAETIVSAVKAGNAQAELLGGGSAEPLATATISFIDNRIDRDSNSVAMRASVKGGERISAGQFVQVKPIGLRQPEGLYVPVSAIGHGDEGPYLWIVDPTGKAAIRPVKTGARTGDLVRVTEGLRSGEKIVLEGGLKLQPGMTIVAR
ncbi:membrane fusion protein, multidrug efflux system [Sphingobium faniae]|nr:membrane fusion protein, multidrug efflux system [Sphingobium faniae]